MERLYLNDEAGCIGIHLVAGASALAACYVIEPRLGKFVNSMSAMLGANQVEPELHQRGGSLLLQQKEAQSKIDRIERYFDLQLVIKGNISATANPLTENKVIDLKSTPANKIAKIYDIINSQEKDSFLFRTSTPAMALGTMIMWISIAQFSGGIHLDQSQNP